MNANGLNKKAGIAALAMWVLALAGILDGDATEWLMFIGWSGLMIVCVVSGLMGLGDALLELEKRRQLPAYDGVRDPPPSAVLTPSDAVYLDGDRFAALTGGEGHLLPGREMRVDGAALAEQLCAAALVADHKSGTIRLVAGQTQGKWRRKPPEAMFVQPLDGSCRFPPESLEARLASAADLLGEARRPVEVWEAVHYILPACPDPCEELTGDVCESLAPRGWLQVTRSARSRIIPRAEVHVSTRTHQVVDARAVEVGALLDEFKQQAPESFGLLIEEIEKGLRKSQQRWQISFEASV